MLIYDERQRRPGGTVRRRENGFTNKMATEQSTVTVLDVAREAGVSVSTVSRILNGTARVADDKRAAVEAAIARLDFKPNLYARSLKMGTSMTIGLLTQDIESPFFTRVMKGIEEGLTGSGYAPMIVSGHWNAVEEMERVRLLMARRIDGLVILNGELSNEEVIDIAARIPVVATGRVAQAPDLHTIRLDHENGGYLATRHLLGLGHRKIALITGPDDHLDAIDRISGYRRAFLEIGLEPDPGLIVAGDFTESGGVLAMTRLLESGKSFTAMFASNDQSAMGARMVMHRKGLRVPDDISLIGFDDLPATAYLTPPLTTVRQPLFEVGLSAANVLLRMLGKEREPVEIPPLEVIIRETTRRL
jgi:LacI family transcriptional regulator